MRTKRVVAIGGGLGLAAAVAGYFVARGAGSATDRHRAAEAKAYAEATGASLGASRAIVDLAEVRLTDVVRPSDLRDLLMSFDRFEGEDRRQVARFCVAFLFAPGVGTLDAERRDVAQIAIKSILTEFVDDEQIVGVAYSTAAHLGLREDPFVRSLAQETLDSPRVDDGVKAFVVRVMFPSPADAAVGETPPP
jgi:hypothetical protein